MNNRFSQFFNEQMTSKEARLMFYKLIDSVRYDSKGMQELKEVYIYFSDLIFAREFALKDVLC